MFNEAEWMKMIFLLADTQQWLDDMAADAIGTIPVQDKRKFLQKSYYLSVRALAHILERHYYKIPRYPQAGKFHIPVTEILHYMRQAFAVEPKPIPGKLSLLRIFAADKVIGFDKSGNPAIHISIITDAGGKIITAFPGIWGEKPCTGPIQTL